MTRHDPGIDPAALSGEAAKKAEALAEARAAALSGDWTPARQLAGISREADKPGGRDRERDVLEGAAPLWEADPDRRDSGPSGYWRP